MRATGERGRAAWTRGWASTQQGFIGCRRLQGLVPAGWLSKVVLWARRPPPPPPPSTALTSCSAASAATSWAQARGVPIHSPTAWPSAEPCAAGSAGREQQREVCVGSGCGAKQLRLFSCAATPPHLRRLVRGQQHQVHRFVGGETLLPGGQGRRGAGWRYWEERHGQAATGGACRGVLPKQA